MNSERQPKVLREISLSFNNALKIERLIETKALQSFTSLTSITNKTHESF